MFAGQREWHWCRPWSLDLGEGAVVAYAMDITSFDPLENGLMFEDSVSTAFRDARY